MKISIIIPCYNAEKWIEKCVLSALGQTYEDVEVIVVDNESTDSSIDILNSIQEENNSLILSTAQNIYPNCWDEAKSKGLELMSGDYVTIMGSDDYLSDKYIENCAHIISAAPEKIRAIQSPMMGVAEDKGEFKYTGLMSHTYSSVSEFKNLCLEKCPVNTPSVIYSSELYKDGILAADPLKYGGAADYDLYCKLADLDIFIYPVPIWLGFHYRWHEDQATWKVQREPVDYDKMIRDYWSDIWKIND